MSRPLKSFIIWNFVVTLFLYFLSYQAKNWSFFPSHFSFFILLISTFVPLVASYLFAKKYYGPRGVEKLFSTFKTTALQSTSMSIAISPLLLLATGIVSYPIFFDSYFSITTVLKEHSIYSMFSVLVWFLPFIPLAFSDTIGWRGFALPHFQARYTAFSSSIFIGLLNAINVLIIFSIRQEFDLLFSLRIILSMVFQSFLLTATFNYSKGHVLPCLIFNLVFYFIIALDPDFLTLVATIGYVLLSAYYINRYGRVHISEGHRIKNFYKKVLSSKTKRKILELDEDEDEALEI